MFFNKKMIFSVKKIYSAKRASIFFLIDPFLQALRMKNVPTGCKSEFLLFPHIILVFKGF